MHCKLFSNSFFAVFSYLSTLLSMHFKPFMTATLHTVSGVSIRLLFALNFQENPLQTTLITPFPSGKNNLHPAQTSDDTCIYLLNEQSYASSAFDFMFDFSRDYL